MLTLLAPERFKQLRDIFVETGYTESNLRDYLGAPELPSSHLRNLPRLLDRTSAPTLLNALLRWFWLGRVLNKSELSGTVSEELFSMLVDSGLIEVDGELLTAQAMLLPMADFVVASDHPSAFESRQSELVLWPNPTSKFMNQFALRRHSSATLDLGTGSGILSLFAADHSDVVIATDLSPRAAAFANFNAKLNGVENIEVLTGDCFAPVAGRKFDLILSNPPFFITPQTDYLFCDNPMDLDSLCRRLVKEVPEYLNEDAYFEMLCEWAQIDGEPWEERIAEWLQDTGCDAWVMKGSTKKPEEYAQQRIREISQDSSTDAAQYDGYMNYYRQRRVEAIHDGLIVMRRRTGDNFVRIEEVPTSSNIEVGDAVLSTFGAHDLLRECKDDEKLLAIRLKLASNVRLDQVGFQAEGKWQAESITLRRTTGLPFRLGLQPQVAEFLATCDGTRTTEEVIRAFAAVVAVPHEKVQMECLAMIRKLIERGLIVVAPV